MNSLQKFYNKTLKYELINKFNYQNVKNIPKLEKIVLNFNCKTPDLRNISANLLAFELITGQKGVLTQAKNPNILLKIRKGHPIGCKITLRKKQMFQFLEKIITKTFPQLKDFKKFKVNNKKMKKKTFSYQIKDTFSFSELEAHYYIFNNISKLNITIISNSKIDLEMLFTLKSLQFPFNTKN